MLYLIFPSFVILLLGLLIHFAYRGPSRINEVFIEYRRPVALRRTIRFWFGLMIGLFLVVQWLRFPFFVYILQRIMHPSTSLATPFDIVHTFGLFVVFFAELTVIGQWMMYLLQCWRGTVNYHPPTLLPLVLPAPSVALFIPCCDEEPATLRRSLSSASRLNYPNLKVYLLENSRKTENKALLTKLAKEYGVEVLCLVNRGNKGRALNDGMKMLTDPPAYLAVLDADQDIQSDFLKDVVPLLEANRKLAFVQTAQLYCNPDETRLSRAAAQQETLHYDTILEGKGSIGMAICCGTNFVMRWEALEEVGLWDEESVSEDMATSFQLHWRGWKSLYIRKAYAIGVGPTTLNAFWKQQKRWAMGSVSVLREVIRSTFTRTPRPIRAQVWWEYLWSSGYYVQMLALASLATFPILLMVLVRLGAGTGILSPYQMKPIELVYLSVYPLYATVMFFPYIHMKLRGYKLRNLLMLQGILAVTIPVYLFAVLRGLIKTSSFFEVSPKKKATRKSSLLFSPQTYLFAALLAAGSLVFTAIASHPVGPTAWIVLFWCLFYTLSFGHFFVYTVFNRPPRDKTCGMPNEYSTLTEKAHVVPETAEKS